MSQQGFGFPAAGGLAIFQDSTENIDNIGPRKTKREDMQAKAPASKRAALGTITNTTRVQPSRAAKQPLSSDGFMSSNNENAQGKTFNFKPTFPAMGGGAPFAIFNEDSNSSSSNFSQSSVSSKEQTSQSLHPAVTNVRQPLSTVNVFALNETIEVESSPVHDEFESPMVLDTTLDRVQDDSAEARFEQMITVPEYADEIYKYLRQHELRHRPKVGYMKKQPDISISMRTILIDWLVEVAEEYKLHRETLFLAVNYIDRFLSEMSVLRGKLQLVGAASMFLAAKFEEIYPPEVGEFVYITDDTYSKKQVLRMEHLILKVLSFDVAVPTINCFCEKFLKDIGADEKLRSMSMFLAELTLIDSETYMKYPASMIAAASVCLASRTLGRDPWPMKLQEKSGYVVQDFEECLLNLHKSFQNAPSHPQQAVMEKYKQKQYQQVSQLTPPTSLFTH